MRSLIGKFFRTRMRREGAKSAKEDAKKPRLRFLPNMQERNGIIFQASLKGILGEISGYSQSPATEREIDAVLKKIKKKVAAEVPAELQELWRTTDGVDFNGTCIYSTKKKPLAGRRGFGPVTAQLHRPNDQCFVHFAIHCGDDIPRPAESNPLPARVHEQIIVPRHHQIGDLVHLGHRLLGGLDVEALRQGLTG
jgi:hypothetical protein